MNFELSSTQLTVQQTFARFSDSVIAPSAAALDEAGCFPRDIFRQLSELGFFGIRYPQSVGGSGMDLVSFCLALEEISRGSLAVAGCAAMQSLMGTDFLFKLGSQALHQHLLLRHCGERRLERSA